MAGVSTVTVTQTLTGGNTGQEQLGPSTVCVNTTASELTTSQTLSAGANTVTVPTVPSTPTGVVIVPPATNTQTIILKGVTGDTGIGISPNTPTAIPFATSPSASFCLTAGGTIAGVLFRWC